MSIQLMIKRIIKYGGKVTRYIPFLNSISLHGATLYTSGAILWKTKILCTGENNIIRLSKGCILRNCHIYVRGNSNHVVFQSDVHAVGAEIWIEDDSNTVTIGEKTNLWGKIHLACIEGTSISFGKECLCSSDIVIRTGDSHSIIDGSGKRINPSNSVIIGDHVWIGNRVQINKGVKISRNTVIGAAAVVTRTCSEEGVVLAGVPARVVKENINWNIQRLPIQ